MDSLIVSTRKFVCSSCLRTDLDMNTIIAHTSIIANTRTVHNKCMHACIRTYARNGRVGIDANPSMHAPLCCVSCTFVGISWAGIWDPSGMASFDKDGPISILEQETLVL